MAKVKLSKDGSTIDYIQSENIPGSLRKFRQSPEIEGFYRFIYENDLQKEAFEILHNIVKDRRSKKDNTEDFPTSKKIDMQQSQTLTGDSQKKRRGRRKKILEGSSQEVSSINKPDFKSKEVSNRDKDKDKDKDKDRLKVKRKAKGKNKTKEMKIKEVKSRDLDKINTQKKKKNISSSKIKEKTQLKSKKDAKSSKEKNKEKVQAKNIKVKSKKNLEKTKKKPTKTTSKNKKKRS